MGKILHPKNYELKLTSVNLDLTSWTPWNRQPGPDVEKFVKSQLEESIVDLHMAGSTLSGYNAFGEVVATTEVIVSETEYRLNVTPISIEIGSTNYAQPQEGTNIQGPFLNSNSDFTATLYLNLEAKGAVANSEFVDVRDKNILVGFCQADGTHLPALGTQLYTNKRNGLVALTNLENYLKRAGVTNNVNGIYLYIQALDPNSNITSSEQILRVPITIRNITISYNNSLLITDGAVKFTSNSVGTSYKLEYYLDSTSSSPLTVTYSSSDSAYVVQLTSEGTHALCARVINTDNGSDLASPWLSVNVLYQKLDANGEPLPESTLTAASVVISNIPTQIYNCDSPKLFEIVTTSKLAGDITVYAFKSENMNIIQNLITALTYMNFLDNDALFKEVNLNLKFSDSSKSLAYYAYSEFEDLTNTNTFLKFIIKTNNDVFEHSALMYRNETITQNTSFSMTMVESLRNERKELLHVSNGKVIDYSQINTGTLFKTDVVDSLDNADGFKVGEGSDAGYSYFKVSPIEKLFNEPKPLRSSTNPASALLPNNGNGFSIEFTIKSYNINDIDDEIMSIGNLKVYPSYLRVDTEDKGISNGKTNVHSLYVSSRADFADNEITHIVITYDPAYKPSTYNYENLFPGYNAGAQAYPCLKIYINGTVNRVREVAATLLIKDGTFSLQIHPSNSTVNFYNFRTYNRCLSYEEVKRNRISSLISNAAKLSYFLDNDITYQEYDFETSVAQSTELIGRVSLGKCLGDFHSQSFPERTYKPKNVLLFIYPEGGKPLYYGTTKLEASTLKNDASILVKYAINSTDSPTVQENCKKSSGRLYARDPYLVRDAETGQMIVNPNYDDYYKAQGSSAKKYGGAHNTQFAKFYFVPEEDFTPHTRQIVGADDTLIDETYIPEKESGYKPATAYNMPTDQTIGIEKLVGKVNYASSMQAHKPGACKLYHDAYANSFSDWKTRTNGGRKAVLEEPFFYFYITLDNCKPRSNGEAVTLQNITWDDIDFEKAEFFGFQTWGSAKGDKPTFAFNKKSTPEYIVFEGADNANSSTNFKCPWAAQQMFAADNDKDFYHSPVKQQQSGWDSVGNKPDYLTGILIDDETIAYRNILSGEDRKSVEKNPDSWDVSYGVEEKDKAVNKYLFIVKDKAKKTFNIFAEFYNLIYTFDFSSLTLLGMDLTEVTMDSINYSTSKKYVALNSPTTISGQDLNKDSYSFVINRGDVIRWDEINGKWVPAGLYYNKTVPNQWDSFNIVSVFNQLVRAVNDNAGDYANLLYDVRNSLQKTGNTFRNLQTTIDVSTLYIDNALFKRIQRGFAEAFRIVVTKYMDVNDVAFHQAFIRFVSGTDNRAKNTYWQIIGHIYTEVAEYTPLSGAKEEGTTYYKQIDGEWIEAGSADLTDLYTKTMKWKDLGDKGDYKIRLFQDDMDTIFATDNNGQLIKPYFLMEPPYDSDNEHLWGDSHSGFFYNFDMIFTSEIKEQLGNIIEYATGSLEFTEKSTNFYKDFLSVQYYFPSVAYNHTSEIYYETIQTMFREGVRNTLGTELFGDSFENNQVRNPISLSHGSCLESEIQFLKNRIYMLATYAGKGKIKTGTSIKMRNETGGSTTVTFDLDLNNLGFTSYNYPNILVTKLIKSNNDELHYNSLIDEGISTSYNTDSTFKDGYVWNLAKYGKNDYSMSPNISMQLSGAGSTWDSTDTYRSIEINSGYLYLENINFPNASYVSIDRGIYDEDGNLTELKPANYSMEELGRDTLDMAKYLTSVEELRLIGVELKNDIVDFSNCTRLAKLNLSNCYGFKTINLPDSSKLTEALLPQNIENLTVSWYPNLTAENFNFDDTPTISRLTIDCRNEIDLIYKLLSYNINLKTTILTLQNIPEEGIVFNKELMDRLTRFQLIYIPLGSKIWIGDSVDCIGNRDLCEPISWTDKLSYVLKFGNIDAVSPSNITIYYKLVNVTSASIKVSTSLATSSESPIDLKIVGNTIGIVPNTGGGYRLNITYTLGIGSTLATVNPETGYVTILNTSDLTGTLELGATITGNNGTSIVARNSNRSLYCSVTLGFRIPLLGDFAYADGHFDSNYDASLEIVGFVFYVNSLGNDSYDVRICSWNALGSYRLGPAHDVVDAYEGNPQSYSENQSSKQQAVRNLINLIVGSTINSDGMTINQSIVPIIDPSIKLDSGLDSNVDITVTVATEYTAETNMAIPSGTIQNNTYTDIPDHLTSGLSTTRAYYRQALANMKRLSDSALNFNQTQLTADNFNSVTNSLSTLSGSYVQGVPNLVPNITQYSAYGGYEELIYPAFSKAFLYEPNTEVELDEAYTKYHWYIPSAEEINWLVFCRIRSCMNNLNDYMKWNSTTLTEGNTFGFFKNTHLSSAYMRYYNNMTSCDSNSGNGSYYPSDMQFSYGTYKDWSTDRIGWSSNPSNYSNYGSYSYGSDANEKDSLQYIIPVCKRTYSKANNGNNQ